jgi:SOS response regulatory protein OraA/RecX
MKVLERVWQKKFNRQKPRDIKDRTRQIRFLIYRGFTPEQVHLFMGGL